VILRFKLSVYARDERLTVCDGEGGAEGTFCPGFNCEEDRIIGSASVKIIHPGFEGVENSETDGD